MSHLLDELLAASGQTAFADEVTEATTQRPGGHQRSTTGQPLRTQNPAIDEVNLTPFMHIPCADICVELKARIEQTNGLEMVDAGTLEDIVDGLLLELYTRQIERTQ